MTPAQMEKERADADRLLTLDPTIAGETIAQGIKRNRDRILIGDDARAAAFILRLFPVSYWNIIGRFIES